MDEMRERILAAAKRHRLRCGEFLQELIKIPSESGAEEGVAVAVRKEMLRLGYQHVDIDRFGNVIGRIGEGRTKLVLDAHIDTPSVGDRSAWRFDPYQGDVKAAKIFGHGAANNKGGLAAIVQAGSIIQELDLAADCTIYVIGSIQAVHCEGLAYKALFEIEKLNPHYMVLTMPTGLRIARGHRGRAEIRMTLRGLSAHVSAPEKGSNAIYGMARIIQNIEALNETLPKDPLLGKASAIVTQVEAISNGPSVLPDACRIVVDRRLVPGETSKKVLQQLKEACQGIRTKIEVVQYDTPSYRGLRLPMEKYFPTWTLPETHPLALSAERTYKTVFKKKPIFDAYTMATAGAYTMGMAHVPTIGFGPGEESYSGPINDHVRLDDLEKAMAFYASLPGYLPENESNRYLRRRR